MISLTLTAQPVINSFAPLSGPAGSIVTITGSRFASSTAGNIVYVGGVRATVTFASPNSLTIIVPLFARSQPIAITVTGLTAHSKLPFIYSFTGVDSSFAPSSFGTLVKYKLTQSYPYSAISDVDMADFDGDGKPDIMVASATAEKNLFFLHNESTPGNLLMGTISHIAFDFSPIASTIADFDGDGKMDIALVAFLNNLIYVCRNTSTPGTISFGVPQVMLANSSPSDAKAADFNGDGKIDLVVSNQWEAVSIFKNTSTPGVISFHLAQEAFVGRGAQSLAIADLNGDGKLDVAVANPDSGRITILKNTSSLQNISFYLPADIPTGPQPAFLVSHDFDGDGKPDLAVGLFRSKKFAVLRNTSDVNFYHFDYIEFTDTAGPDQLSVDDMNGDGIADLVITNAVNNTISVFRNSSSPGHIVLSPQSDYMGGTAPYPLATGDIDGDGKPDIVAGTADEGSVGVLRNKANEPGLFLFSPDTANASKLLTISGVNFSATTAVSIGGVPASQFRVESQSRITATVAAGASSGTIAVTTSYGTASKTGFVYQQPPVINSFQPAYGNAGTSVTISGSDFSSVRSVWIGGVPAAAFRVVSPTTIIAAAGAGTSGPVTVTTVIDSVSKTGFVFLPTPVIYSFSPSFGPAGSRVLIKGAHFSNPPFLPIVHFGTIVGKLIHATDSTVEVTVPPAADYLPITVTSNFMTAFSEQPFCITFPGAGATFTSTSFVNRPAMAYNVAVTLLAAADLDTDGLPDLAYAQPYAPLNIEKNNSQPGMLAFSHSAFVGPGVNYGSLLPADLDGDGRVDLIRSNTFGPVFNVFQNQSSPGVITIGIVQQFTGDLYGQNTKLAIADLDGDGRPDLVFSASNPEVISVYRSLSRSGWFDFEPHANVALETWPTCIAITDLNHDGKPDIVIGFRNASKISVFPNNSMAGKISLGAPFDLPTDNPVTSISMADFDKDGRPDIAITTTAGGNASALSLFKNISFGAAFSFIPGATYSLPDNTMGLVASDLDGDEKPDLAAYATATSNLYVIKNLSSGAIAFASPISYPTSSPPYVIGLGDMDADGKTDILYGTSTSDTIRILRNQVGEALVIPSGANPVTGGLYNKLTIDSSVQIHNNAPYVQRHYDMEPAVGAETATATVTLYFSQADFDNYNAYPGGQLALPTSSSDAAGKAAIRVYQYHGFSATGVPGTYSGQGKELDPDDNNIRWNAITQLWEVSFDVVGFSGFFVATKGSALLPLRLVSFNGFVADKKPFLRWTSATEINLNYFEIQRSTDGLSFKKLAAVKAGGGSNPNKNYSFTDITTFGNESYYYRLKMVDQDGAFSYSKVIVLHMTAGLGIQLLPNPAHNTVIVSHPASTDATIRISDLTGRLLIQKNVSPNSIQTTIQIGQLARGVYHLNWSDRKNALTESLLIE
ncbi:MAG: FG-GAP-like repeat-containing protein [Chitinophagaceae bacterium]